MREWLTTISVWGIAGCAVLSLIPFPFLQKWKSWNLYLPVAALVLYGVYEVSLPTEDVKRQITFILPLFLFLFVNGMAKVVLLAALQNRASRERRHLRDMPQISLQLLLALPLAFICAGMHFLGWI